MDNEPHNETQKEIAELATRMACTFMPCGGQDMILGYAAILVLECGIREDMPPRAVQLAKQLADSIKVEMETTEEPVWQDEK